MAAIEQGRGRGRSCRFWWEPCARLRSVVNFGLGELKHGYAAALDSERKRIWKD